MIIENNTKILEGNVLIYCFIHIFEKAFLFPLSTSQPNCDLEPKLFKQWPKQQPKKKKRVSIVSIETMSLLAKAKIKQPAFYPMVAWGYQVQIARLNLSVGSGCPEYKIELHWSRCWSPRGEGVDWSEKGSLSKRPLSECDCVRQLTRGCQMPQRAAAWWGLGSWLHYSP